MNEIQDFTNLKNILKGAKLIFETAGLKGNQLALALDKTAKHYTGESLLALAGIELEAEPQDNADEILQRVNELLKKAGMPYTINFDLKQFN